ncbi:ABC transporter permease [Virgisporangium aurantiacum]|uniref:Peptide ABC transporter permease n=1 Tax=Virgisporangium aurantiacum TaxID=175570 RepID=A0A8J3YYH5_9ACTN|nr:ABC transporter permease [Virgisporangium aurantiacum]GIJ52997.1 peptide ABC transporter permease [Virgisporangium aurantiacum]
MLAYAIRRLLIAIPVLLVASMIVFALTQFTGDPVEEKYAARNPPVPQQTIDIERKRLHLDDPVVVQYGNWIKNLVTKGDWGPSINAAGNIGDELSRRVVVTLRLVIFAMLLALVLAVISGVLSATKQYSWLDYIFTFFGFLFLAMPAFWVAVLLKQGALSYNEATGTRTFYTIGARSVETEPGLWNTIADIFGHSILPTLSLALITYAAWSRFQRSSMLEVLNSDYVRLARAKGLSQRKVLTRHALRTALIPMTTVSALGIATVIGGAVITETVFEWQGMGRYLIDSIATRDRYAIMGWLLIAGIFVVVGNLVADILYGVLDPRIRYE